MIKKNKWTAAYLCSSGGIDLKWIENSVSMTRLTDSSRCHGRQGSTQLILLMLCLSFLPAGLTANTGDLSKGIELTKQGKYREALTILRPGINAQQPSAPENATNYYYQAYCYYQLHDLQDARTLFHAVASRYARSPEAQLASRFLKQLDTRTSAALPADSVKGATADPKILAAIARTSEQPDSNNLDPENEITTPAAETLPNEGKFYFSPGDHGHMNVQATINGRPINCWFDTGAPGLFFSMNQLKQLGIATPSTPPDTYVSGWAGRKIPAWNMSLTIKLGNMSRTLNAKVQAGDYDLQPLIGYSFVQGYEYQIDQAGRCVYMKKSGTNSSSMAINSLYDVPCKIIQTKPIVPLEINGRKAPVFVDTGSNSTNLDLATVQALGIQIPADAPTTMATGVGGSLVYRIIYVDLRMGPISKKEFPIQVGGAAGSCVGQDFLSGWRYTIDENKSLLRFFH